MLLDEICEALQLNPNWRDLNTEYNSFSPVGIQQKLERHGLKIVRISEVGESNG